MTSAANSDGETYLVLLDGVFSDKPLEHSSTRTVNDIFRLAWSCSFTGST